MSEVTEQTEQQSHFLGAVSKADGSPEQWAVELLVGSTPVDFKIDTGADVNVICEETYHSLMPKRALQPAEMPLDSPGGELQCIGQFQSTVTYKGKTHPLTAYVIRVRTVNNLLSRPLSVKIDLVRRVNETVCNRGHPQAYGTHGTLKTEPVNTAERQCSAICCIHSTTRASPYAAKGKGRAQEDGGKWHHRQGDTAHGLVCTHGASLEEHR